jgi:hypothetical protein
MIRQHVSKNIRPFAFADRLVGRSFHEFVGAYGDTQLLLIKLDDPTGELESGLSSMEVGANEAKASVLGFHTVVAGDGDISSVTTQVNATNSDAHEVARRIGSVPHFVVPLRKRAADSTYSDRISVGRARNKDLVLRDRSVSKFHGWFERDERGSYHVADAGSKNGTKVNSTLLAARELAVVKPGDVVRFGSVEVALCYAETLWRALHAE